MKRGVLILLILLLIVIGVGFLALMWIDMRNSIQNQPQRQSSTQEPRQREERSREGRSREGESRERQSHEGQAHEGQGEDRREPGNAVANCGVTCESTYFATWTWPADGSCHAVVKDGYPEPDARCTPGGAVPGITADTLRDPGWRTKCIRNCQSSEQQKHVTYEWYGIARPAQNSGATQVCELDHLVPLEIGGADGLGNIWPECGPDAVTLRERYFKQKDIVENYLAARVKAGEMPLDEAQRGVARDWVQYLEPAKSYCKGGRC